MQNLLNKCRDYNRKAQRQMVDLLTPKLTPICFRYAAGDQELVKDLLQESLIKIFNNINKFELYSEAEFFGWCRKITVNTALTILKKRKITILEIKQDDSFLSNGLNVIDHLQVKDILSILEQLPIQHRTVFNLYVIDGYSHKEIGQMLGVQESSSRVFLARAKSKMVELMTRDNANISKVKRG